MSSTSIFLTSCCAIERPSGAAAAAEFVNVKSAEPTAMAASPAPWRGLPIGRAAPVTASPARCLEAVAGIHRDAHLPRYHGKTFVAQTAGTAAAIDHKAPAAGRKAVLFATCFVNFNNPGIGNAARQVLARNGVETEIVYPACCGMPQLEQGEIDLVAAKARKVTSELAGWIDRGYDVIALVPSCALMLKFEWPLILPDDPTVARISQTTSDITEYVIDIAPQ